MRISDWSSDVCSSDLAGVEPAGAHKRLVAVHERVHVHWQHVGHGAHIDDAPAASKGAHGVDHCGTRRSRPKAVDHKVNTIAIGDLVSPWLDRAVLNRMHQYAARRELAYLFQQRSEEHTSELQPLMRISYAV